MRPCRHEDRSCDAPISWEGQSLDKLLVRHDSIIAGRQHAIDSLQQKRMNEGHCFVGRPHSHGVIIPSPIGSEWGPIRSHSDVAGIRLITLDGLSHRRAADFGVSSSVEQASITRTPPTHRSC